MASFKDQVEAAMGQSLDTSITSNTDLSSFLVDGVMDVVNKMIRLRPKEIPKFCTTTNSTSPVGKKGKILSILREHDDTDILRVCTPISPQFRYEATDTESLHYRSKYNPGYYELNGTIHCVPQAASGNNDIVVTQVHYDTGLVHGDTYPTAIDNFPDEYAYLVVLYAAGRCVLGLVGDMTTQDIIWSAPPEVPTLSDSSITFSTNLPTYTPPKVGGATEELTTTITDGTVGTDADFQDVSDWWEVLGHLIEDEEDVELSQLQLGKLRAYTDAYTQAMANQVNEFNEANAVYQAELKRVVQEAQLISRDDGQKVSKYSAEVQEYQIRVQADLADKQGKYKWYMELYQRLVAEYHMAFGAAPQAGGGSQRDRGRRRGSQN